MLLLLDNNLISNHFNDGWVEIMIDGIDLAFQYIYI